VLLTYVACAALTAVAWWSSRDAPPPRLAVGVGLFATGIALWLWGRGGLDAEFAQVARVPAALVTGGAFGRARHPLYLATTIACLGQAVAAGSAAGFGLWLTVIGIFAARARREERLLRDAFGPVWDAYARRTPRGLP
jgi:protein-S-isoprenylcysteine O-methyltransferase Ste14